MAGSAWSTIWKTLRGNHRPEQGGAGVPVRRGGRRRAQGVVQGTGQLRDGLSGQHAGHAPRDGDRLGRVRRRAACREPVHDRENPGRPAGVVHPGYRELGFQARGQRRAPVAELG
jgi:hypothetical protein